jgi:hypothetical protein
MQTEDWQSAGFFGGRAQGRQGGLVASGTPTTIVGNRNTQQREIMAWLRSPKKIQELIKHEVEKCQAWYKSGKFWLVVRVPAAKLKNFDTVHSIAQSAKQVDAPLPSILLISSEAKKDIAADYVKLAGKASSDTVEQEIIVSGTYESDKKIGSYTFIYDDAHAAQGKKLFADAVLSTYLSLALWLFMPDKCTKVYWYGGRPPEKLDEAEVDKPVLGNEEEELTSWDVVKLLRTVAALHVESRGAFDPCLPQGGGRFDDLQWRAEAMLLPRVPLRLRRRLVG